MDYRGKIVLFLFLFFSINKRLYEDKYVKDSNNKLSRFTK